MIKFNPIDCRIFEGIVGSNLYGTNTSDSDIDYRGICIPPKEVLLNPFMGFDQKDSGFEEEDRTIYSLGRFFKLCADANPNIIEILFIPEDKIILNSKKWELIQENRDLFVSKKARHTFSGYAFAQLNAIKTHRQWFINPPKKKPERKDYGLTDSPLFSGGTLAILDNINYNLIDPKYREELYQEKKYRFEKLKWDNYNSWKVNRNPKRMAMEEKYGYDCKHASHLFRLMNEGKELLLTGKITFPLEDSEEILAIKNGKYLYDDILQMAESFDSNFKIYYDQSLLPNSPDKNKLLELYLNLIDY